MVKLLNVFLQPKGIAISLVALTYFCFIGINYLRFQERYQFWTADYAKKTFYLEQTICKNYDVKARLEGLNECDQNALFLMTSPGKRALLDVLEGMYLCHGGACAQWFGQLLVIIILLGVFVAYVFLRHTAWAIDMTNKLSNQLPAWGFVHKKTC
jgi:hypothetical protein